LGEVLITPHREIVSLLRNIHRQSLPYQWGDPGVDGRTNIKMDVQEVGSRGMDLIERAQDRDRWQALVNAVMNLRVL
jgi:hypothetical protein